MKRVIDVLHVFLASDSDMEPLRSATKATDSNGAIISIALFLQKSGMFTSRGAQRASQIRKLLNIRAKTSMSRIGNQTALFE